tara:strand:+ start:8307 stop:9497 length:1191 start_codon:yes stop_codon:yes gene_type:complete
MGEFTIGSTIYTKLSMDATITGYVGTSPVRIFPDVAPLNVAQTFPYIVYTVISQVPTNTKGPIDEGDAVATGPSHQRSPLDVVRVQISSFTQDYGTGVVLADRIRKVLDRGVGSGFTVGSGPDIDSIVYDGLSTNYESKTKPQGVHEFTQEYIIRIICTDIAPGWTNVYSSSFDGVDQYVQIGDSSSFSFGNGTTDSPFSISFWAYFDSMAGSVGVLGKDSGVAGTQEYQIRLGFSNLRFRLYDPVNLGYITKNLNVALNTSQWYHITCTYDGSGVVAGMLIYVDASIPSLGETTSGSYTAMDDTAADFTIGATNATYFEGNLDEIAMFDIELSAAQVLAIWNAGTPDNLVSHTGLVGYWRMGDSGAFPGINDNSTNSNNGTCQNMIASDFENVIP